MFKPVCASAGAAQALVFLVLATHGFLGLAWVVAPSAQPRGLGACAFRASAPQARCPGCPSRALHRHWAENASCTTARASKETSDSSESVGLPGDWEVERGEGVPTTTTSTNTTAPLFDDTEYWGNWAREWTRDPKRKSEKLISQWEEEAKARGTYTPSAPGMHPHGFEAGGEPHGKGKGRKGRSSKAKKKLETAGRVASMAATAKGFGKKHTGVPKGVQVRQEGGEPDASPIDWGLEDGAGGGHPAPPRDFGPDDIAAQAARIGDGGGQAQEQMVERLRAGLGEHGSGAAVAGGGGSGGLQDGEEARLRGFGRAVAPAGAAAAGGNSLGEKTGGGGARVSGTAGGGSEGGGSAEPAPRAAGADRDSLARFGRSVARAASGSESEGGGQA